MTKVTIEILPGELADRIAILRLRFERLSAGLDRDLLGRDLRVLQDKWSSLGPCSGLVRELADELAHVNARLWVIEDELRLHESRGDFGSRFLALARSVYQLNDRRSLLKRRINLKICGTAGEEKIHLAGTTCRSGAANR